MGARKFKSNRSGNVAMMFAIIAPVLVLASGGVIDLGHFLLRKTQIQDAADAASVGSVAKTSQAYADAAALPSGSPIPGILGPQAQAQSIFNADKPSTTDTDIGALVWTGSRTGQNVNANVSVSATFHTDFLRMIGISTLPISSSSSASTGLPPYVNVYVIVDVSQSMGIASTSTDMTTLYNRVVSYANGTGGDGSPGCIFGCHVTSPVNYGSHQMQKYTNEYLAHSISPYVTLRIDAAVSAIQNIISQAKTQASGNNIKIGLYTINEDPTNGSAIRQISAPSFDYNTLTTTATAIDLGNNDSGGEGDSNFYDELNKFYNTYLPANGDGSSAASPQNYVYIVTDGLVDSLPNPTAPGASCIYSNHCMRTFDNSVCTTLKKRSAVGVIYTIYNPIYKNNVSPTLNSDYQSLGQPYVSGIDAALTSCASSPALYFSASDGPDIVAKMAQLFSATLSTAHITN